MNMADRIQYLRKAKGISQEELAEKVGVSGRLFPSGRASRACLTWRKSSP